MKRLGRATLAASMTALCLLGVPGRTGAADQTIEQRTFWSNVLHEPVLVSVILPANYDPHRQPRYGVMFYLHGGVTEGNRTGIDSTHALAIAVKDLPVIGVVPQVGAPWQDPKEEPPSEVAWNAQQVVQELPRPPKLPVGVVGFANTVIGTLHPDRGTLRVGPPPQRSTGIAPYETHFVNELIPFIESQYNVRRDQGGRAITGCSGGGLGSIMLTAHHPDLFAYVASGSGVYSCPQLGRRLKEMQSFDPNRFAQDLEHSISTVPSGDPELNNHELHVVGEASCMLVAGYYGGMNDPATDEIYYRWEDATELSDPTFLPGNSQVAQPVTIDLSGGDKGQVESFSRDSLERYDEFLTRIGVQHHYYFHPGTAHCQLFDSDVQNVFVPAAAAIITNPAPDVPPDGWNYRTIKRSFRIWGYDLSVERPNTEFLTLRNVRSGGFTVLGTGNLLVKSTARLYQPGARYRVTTSGPDGATFVQALYADDDGRLGPFVVHLGATRMENQSSLLETAGQFSFDEYQVSIVNDEAAVPDAEPFCADIWVYPFLPCHQGLANPVPPVPVPTAPALP